MDSIKTTMACLFLVCLGFPAQAALVCQDFEAGNGTLPPYEGRTCGRVH